MAARASMTRWYSVPRLVSIGVRVAISTVFGEFADRRDTIAAERPLDPAAPDAAHVYAADADGEFWLDFVADNGDGWNSTYAIARLIAQPTIKLREHALPRARLLVMGGDQVYPTPSREAYIENLVTPYREASNRPDWPQQDPHLYAIPGNHDWYDGLSSFLNLFCWRQLAGPWAIGHSGHRIGGWRTQQSRSYFALSLPHDWWLWGTDIQLTEYIDQEQINYFEHIARNWMPAGARLILCAGVPNWVYADPEEPEKTFDHFSFIEGLLHRVGRNQRLCVVLTGDSHHYSRYTEDDRHYVTAGGGGAFLHPTHHLPSEKIFKWRWPRPAANSGAAPPPLSPGQTPTPQHTRAFQIGRDSAGKESIYPDRNTSRCLAFRNLAFAIFNWDFALALGVVCAIFAWQLDGVARAFGSNLPLTLSAAPDYWAAVWEYLRLVFVTPWPPLMALIAAAGYCYFADFKTSAGRIGIGALHTLAQMGAVVLMTVALARYVSFAKESLGLILLTGIFGGAAAATVMGIYLLACLNLAGRHWNEAFSALRIRHYKNFLRMRIDASGRLTIYPIGLSDVPQDKSVPPHNPPLSPELIESPIMIQ
jgi:hypothetical protein